MAKKGMKRISRTHTQPRNDIPPVPEISGKAKHGNAKVNPIISGTMSPTQKVFHTTPYKHEEPISSVYSAIDTDLARDNLQNDMTYADLENL